MRRLLSILLLAFFGLPLVSPLFALGTDADAGLPACCRRNGEHHCRGMAERTEATEHGTQLSAPVGACPYSPSSVAVTHPNLLAPGTSSAILALLASQPMGSLQAEFKRRIARDRSRQKRGPPASIAL